MTKSITLTELENIGACRGQRSTLSAIYPDGTIPFLVTEVDTLNTHHINVMWSATLLALPLQVELALRWYDRALAESEVSWRQEVRDTLQTRDVVTVDQLFELRQQDRRSAETQDVSAANGVAYGFLLFVKKTCGDPTDQKVTGEALTVLASHCARAISSFEEKEIAEVRVDLQKDVFGLLETHGASL